MLRLENHDGLVLLSVGNQLFPSKCAQKDQEKIILQVSFSHVQNLRKLPGLPVSNPPSLPLWRRPNRRRKGRERHFTQLFNWRKNEWVGMIVRTVVHITFHGN